MRLSILTILFAGLSALLYFTASHAAAQAPGPVGTVSQIQGPATVTRLGAPRALASGD